MWSGVVEYNAFAQDTSKLSQKEREKQADKLERLFDALEAALKDLPRDTFDPEAIIKTVGRNPARLFEWVRDNTHLVPYRGSLRGPIGVLMDRLGNSLDRSLLLSKLLSIAGYESRLAHGTLSDKHAKDIYIKALDQSSQRIPPQKKHPFQKTDDFIGEYSEKYQIDQKELEEVIYKLKKEHEIFSQKLAERTNRQAALVAKAVEKYRQRDSTESINSQSLVLKDHWWVQFKKNDEWLAMDTVRPTMEFGEALTDINDTYQPEEINKNLFHRLKIRIITEQWTPEKIEEKIVLEHEIRPAELFEERVTITHMPGNWEKYLDVFEEPAPVESLRQMLIKEKEWTPVLSIGSKRFYQSSFNDSGEIDESPQKEKKSAGVRGITQGLFRGLAGQEKSEEKESYLTAEWIEYELLSPGNFPNKIRRQIFDVIGPSARRENHIPSPNITESLRLDRCLSLLSEIEIFIQVCHLSPSYILHLEAKNMLANRDILLNELRQTSFSSFKKIRDKSQEITPLPGLEYGLAYVRYALSEYQDAIYLDTPNIIHFINGILQNQKGEMHKYTSFDIVINRFSIFPKQKVDPFFINLYQGVLDTNAEAFLLDVAGKTTENTAQIFAQSESLGIKWLTIRKATSPEWTEVNLPEDVRARIEDDLAKGYIVIAPQKSITWEGRKLSGWWRVNPKNGVVLGLSSNGSGQAMLEKALTTLHIAANIGCWWEFFKSKSYGTLALRFFICVGMFLGSFGMHVAVSGHQASFAFVFFFPILYLLEHILEAFHGY
jgi:hypothetical protein